MMKLLMILFYLNTTHLHQHKPHSLHTLIHLPLMTNNQLIMVFPCLPPHHHPPITCRLPYDAPNEHLTNHHILMTISIVQHGTVCLLSHLTHPNSLFQGSLPQLNPILLPPTFLIMFIMLSIKLF
ncbi:hypothetical protein AMTRI_Chr08g208280 [Amborella trichopoda]